MADIVTVTLNPALDVSTSVDVVTPDHKLRCRAADREPGGGGINVARVASRLGADVRSVVVAGGATGEQLLALIEAEGIAVSAVRTERETRQSFTVHEGATGHQYRFVLPGPVVSEETIGELVKLLAARPSVRCLVVSGSMPPGTSAEAVTALVNALPGVPAVVDTSGPALRAALASEASLVKPSARELSSVVGRSLPTEADVVLAAQDVMATSSVGAILVSIGAGGAVLVRPSLPPLRLRAPTVDVRSAVGAGDSMVGGLATGLARGLDLEHAAALGVAAGTAAVMTPGTALCSAAGVEELLPLVTVD